MRSGNLNRFYGVVAKRLKQEFPGIKIGGPALCSLNEDLISNLLKYCRDHEVPVDFISWHCYTADVAKLVNHPVRARKLLDSHGFKETETMINEWHYLVSWDGLHRNATPERFKEAMDGPAGMFGIDSAVFNISVVTGWHDTPLDASYYYGYGDATWGFVTLYRELNKNYHSMFLLGQMITRFPNRVEAQSGAETVSILAGSDGAGNCGILVADYRGEAMEIPLDINGVEAIGDPVVLLLDDSSDLEEISVDVTGNQLVLRKRQSGSAAFFVTFIGKIQ